MRSKLAIFACMFAGLATGQAPAGPDLPNQQFHSKWDMVNGKHDLTSDNTGHAVQWSGAGGPNAVAHSQICLFCHTAHAREDAADRTWLWAHDVPTAFSSYSSITLRSTPQTTAASQSAKCLGCHDGTIAVTTGSFGTPGLGSELTIESIQVTRAGKLTSGSGLVVRLASAHPVSFTYDAALAAKHLLRVPAGNGSVDGYGVIPLFGPGANQMECATCHDPHLKTGILRRQFPTGATQDGGTDSFCLYCHL